MNRILTTFLALIFTVSAQAGSTSILDLITNPSDYGIEVTEPEEKEMGLKSYALVGEFLYVDILEGNNRKIECRVNITTDGENISFNDYETTYVAEVTPNTSIKTLARKMRKNNTSLKISIRYNELIVKTSAKIEGNILKFKQKVHDLELLFGLLEIASTPECVIDLDKQKAN